MNATERLLLEHMQNSMFQNVTSDDFAFADSLIDQEDLDKVKKEAENHGND